MCNITATLSYTIMLYILPKFARIFDIYFLKTFILVLLLNRPSQIGHILAPKLN